MREYKILWIDDDVNYPELRQEREALEERGCVITCVTNPDDIDYNNITPFDCIIIDLLMPTGKNLSCPETKFGTRTGLAIIKKIKEKSSYAKTIIYSAFDSNTTKKYCDCHNIPYWSKPDFLADDFADAVIDMINN